jgi:hypothetical protein
MKKIRPIAILIFLVGSILSMRGMVQAGSAEKAGLNADWRPACVNFSQGRLTRSLLPNYA